MNKRIASGVIAGIAAISIAVPAAGLADQGGHPHSKKACKTHRHYGRHQGAGKGHKRGSDRGKKCGLTGPSGGSGSEFTSGPSGKSGPSDWSGPSGPSTPKPTASQHHSHGAGH